MQLAAASSAITKATVTGSIDEILNAFSSISLFFISHELEA